jgi:hypothetical protein
MPLQLEGLSRKAVDHSAVDDFARFHLPDVGQPEMWSALSLGGCARLTCNYRKIVEVADQATRMCKLMIVRAKFPTLLVEYQKQRPSQQEGFLSRIDAVSPDGTRVASISSSERECVRAVPAL